MPEPNELQGPGAAPQFYKLTVEQADQLDRLGPGDEATKLAASFGALAMENSVALVVNPADDGSEQPVRLMALGSDLGTTIHPEKAYPDGRTYPALEEVHSLLSSDVLQGGGAEETADPAEAVERAIEQANLREVLQRYGRLQAAFEDGSRMDRTAFRNAADNVQMTLRSFYMAADATPQGPSQRLGDAPQLLRAAQELGESLQRSAMQVRNTTESVNVEGRRFATDFTESAEQVGRQLQGNATPEAHMVRRATNEVNEILMGIMPRLQRLGEDKVQEVTQAARKVDALGYERMTTIEEAIGILRRISHTIEEMDTDTLRAGRSHQELTDRVGQLTNILRK